MNLNIDFGTALVAAGMSTTAIISYVWLKIGPIEERVKKIDKKCDGIKNDDELNMMMDVKIHKHEKECRQERIAQTSAIKMVKVK